MYEEEGGKEKERREVSGKKCIVDERSQDIQIYIQCAYCLLPKVLHYRTRTQPEGQ